MAQAQTVAPAPAGGVAWLGGLFGGQAAKASNPGETTGLLEDWNSYAGQSRDVEAGGQQGTTSSSTAAITSAAAAAGSFLANSFTSASNSVAALPGQLQNAEAWNA